MNSFYPEKTVLLINLIREITLVKTSVKKIYCFLCGIMREIKALSTMSNG